MFELIGLLVVITAFFVHCYMEYKEEKRLEARPVKRTVKHYLKYGEH